MEAKMEFPNRPSIIRRTSRDFPASDIFQELSQTEESTDHQSRSAKVESDEQKFKPWRVFINHIDSYHGRKLAEFLVDREYVNTQGDEEVITHEDNDEEEGDEELENEIDEERGNKKISDKERSKETEISRKYEVIGTTLDPEYPCPEDVAMIIREPKNRGALLSELIKCGIIVYDITEEKTQVEEARWALNAIIRDLERMESEAPKAFKRNNEIRYFILISTLMTWALTKPLSPEEPELPFTEEDYRKRKSHPNFKQHYQCEKDVLLVKKYAHLAKKLKTLVICCGIIYGEEEGLLDYLFRMAWKNSPFLPIIGKGDNKIPLLHVRDLISVIFNALQEWPTKQYILAVEQDVVPQNLIVKKISKVLTTGKVRNLEMAEAFLVPEITQTIYDVMTMNLNVDPEYIIDKIRWHFEFPFRDNMTAIVDEYRKARNLYPLKIIVLGPPASGKTKVAQYLAKYYCIHYIHVKSLIKDTIHKLVKEIEELKLSGKKGEAESEGSENEEADKGDEDYLEEEEDDITSKITVEDLQMELDEITENLRKNNGRMDDVTLNKLFLRQLQSKECSNQGYVMDGHPKTLEQAKGLFGEMDINEKEDLYEEAEMDDPSIVKPSILPELVIVLESNDEFLVERIIGRPEREIQHTHYVEEHMIRRLKEYRERNRDDYTPLQFFDEMEIRLLIIPIENDVCPDMFPTIYQCLEILGKPRNYGLTEEEKMEARKRSEGERQRTEEAKKAQREREMLEVKREREEKMMEWTNLMEKLKEEEEERLCILAMPLRHYLMKYVFPVLTQGLIEVAKLRPEDPVDFLAEYLFQENPEGKMFEPDYTETLSKLLDTIEKLQDELIPKEELDEEIMKVFKKQKKVRSDASKEEYDMDICSNIKITPCKTSSITSGDTESLEYQEECLSQHSVGYEGDA